MPKRTPTLEQKKIAKQARHALRDQCLERGGIIVEGPVGMGKTVTCGEINAKPIPITKDSKCLNIWVACQNAFAEKQAEEVGVAIGDKPLTQGRLKMLEHRLSITKTGTVNFTVTPASAGNLLNHEINFHKKFIKLLKDMKVTHINIMFDEVHKIYKGSSNKPMRVAAFREKLREIDIVLVVTGVTATPLFDVKTKDQPRLVIRAGTLLGLKTLEALEENTVKVSADETNAIFAQIRPLQTPAPEAFEVSDNKIPGGEPSQEVKAIMDDAKQILLGNALEPNSHIDRVVAFNACRSKAVVQKVLDDRAIEAVLSAGGVQCKTVVEAEDGSLSLSGSGVLEDHAQGRHGDTQGRAVLGEVAGAADDYSLQDEALSANTYHCGDGATVCLLEAGTHSSPGRVGASTQDYTCSRPRRLRRPRCHSQDGRVSVCGPCQGSSGGESTGRNHRVKEA